MAMTFLLLLLMATHAVADRGLMDGIRMVGGQVVTEDDAPKVVILGSSTAAGAGASSTATSWVGLLRAHLQCVDPNLQVINLAMGGYTTYQEMPTGFVPPVGRPQPVPTANITMGLAFKPRLVVVNLPSNDVSSGFSTAEIMANYAVIAAEAEADGVPVWFMTTQPRNFTSQAQRDQQREIANLTMAVYGDHAIDIWTDLAATNGMILPEFDSGDHIHLNDLGHALIFERVVASVWGDTLGRSRSKIRSTTSPR